MYKLILWRAMRIEGPSVHSESRKSLQHGLPSAVNKGYTHDRVPYCALEVQRAAYS